MSCVRRALIWTKRGSDEPTFRFHHYRHNIIIIIIIISNIIIIISITKELLERGGGVAVPGWAARAEGLITEAPRGLTYTITTQINNHKSQIYNHKSQISNHK